MQRYRRKEASEFLETFRFSCWFQSYGERRFINRLTYVKQQNGVGGKTKGLCY